MVDLPGEPVTTEQLRPSELGEIVGQTAVIRRLRELAAGTQLGRIVPPHLLFWGPPGTGKTTTARAFGRAILSEQFENSFNELGTLDDRSGRLLADRLVPQSWTPAKRSAPFRIYFFDEVDGLHAESADALRPALEGRGGHSVFILACNDPARVPAPLRSRCLVLEFGTLSDGEIVDVARRGASRAGRVLPPESIDRIVRDSEGVPRRAVQLVVEELARDPAALLAP